MTARPASLQLLDSYFRAARLAHEYAFRLHRRLVEADADSEHARALLSESAALTLERMPTLARRLRSREREWEEQDLLDPSASVRTVEQMESEAADLAPELAALRARQRQILAELREILTRDL
jgi:hypothetical protein